MNAPFIFIGRNTHQNQSRRNKHWAECKRRAVPFVAIEPRRKFAYVKIDMITARAALTKNALSRIDLLFQEFGEDGERLYLSDCRCSYNRVSIESAESLAMELWRIGTSS